MVDLSLFRAVTPSEDGSSVVIGGGCKWADVSEVLNERRLAVVGGRNSAVGVGGLTLGGELCSSFPPFLLPHFLFHSANTIVKTGGFSFFSPRFGMVCNHYQ